MRKRRYLSLSLAAVLLVLFLFHAGRLLVINHPRPADAILILAGETDCRPARGLELMEQGYARRVILDVPAREKIYRWPLVEIAGRWVSTLPQSGVISVCPIYGLSTKAEAGEAAECARRLEVHSILLVTSDFHTRRALSTFRRELRGIELGVAAASSPSEFGTEWWRHRQWAKTVLYEWMRLTWWKLIDRWY